MAPHRAPSFLASFKMENYKDLDVWKESMNLADSVYAVTKRFPPEERFGLSIQVRKAVVSIPSNIAEGFGRRGIRDRRHFVFMSRGSLFELETQLEIATRQGFINKELSRRVRGQLIKVAQLLNGLIRYLDKQIG